VRREPAAIFRGILYAIKITGDCQSGGSWAITLGHKEALIASIRQQQIDAAQEFANATVDVLNTEPRFSTIREHHRLSL
jgi:hypothetical protein